jgi:hypothetical protein
LNDSEIFHNEMAINEPTASLEPHCLLEVTRSFPPDPPPPGEFWPWLGEEDGLGEEVFSGALLEGFSVEEELAGYRSLSISVEEKIRNA